MGVRRGTRVYACVSSPPSPPARGGEQTNFPPYAGGLRGGELARNMALRAIETLRPGDYILARDGNCHCVLHCIQCDYQGAMMGLLYEQAQSVLWLTATHRVLARCRPRSLGGHSDWSAVPSRHFEYARELRRNMTPPERKLWGALRSKQLGVKFRKQHPIGPYIADFYSRDAALVVEVDGEMAHSGKDQQAYDAARDAYLQNLGLAVLRFPAREVFRNLEAVVDAIRHCCFPGNAMLEIATWATALELLPGDIVFVGPDLHSAPLCAIKNVKSAEIVFDMEVEGVCDLVTEVCAVHSS